MSGIRIRQMCPSDIESAMRLKNAESWNQTESDWCFFLDQNPAICLVACWGNEVIGTVTAINYQNEIAWIGMMLVSRDHRRKGVSSSLLKAIIERLKGCKCIKLDATPSGVNVYRKLGFKEEIGLHRISVEAISSVQEGSYIGGIEQIEKSDMAEISRLDEQVFGANREGLIRHLFENLPRQSLVAKRNGKTTGFIFCRKGTRFTHLGPIVAKSIEDAKALVSRVSRDIEGKPALMDVPAQNLDWQCWLTDLGFSRQRSFLRMFMRTNLFEKSSDQQFAIGGPEIG